MLKSGVFNHRMGSTHAIEKVLLSPSPSGRGVRGEGKNAEGKKGEGKKIPIPP